MDNNDSLVLSFALGCGTVLLFTMLLIAPSCTAVDTCLKNTDSTKAVMCERVIQNRFPLSTEYPNDEKSSR